MNAVALLARLRELGIEVQADGDQLRLRGRHASLTPELRQGAVAHKEALLVLLRAPAAPVCPACGRTDYMPLGCGWRRCWACGQRWGPPTAPDPGDPPDLKLIRDRIGMTDRRKW